MDRFENQLRRVLTDQSPDSGFAARVISEAASRRKQRTSRIRLWIVFAAATSVISGVVLVGYHSVAERREHMIAERAKQDVLVALRITREKLQTVEDRLAYTEH